MVSRIWCWVGFDLHSASEKLTARFWCHVLRPVPEFPAETGTSGPTASPTGTYSGSTATGVGLDVMRGVGHQALHPIRSCEESKAIPARPGRVALHLQALENPVPQAEGVAPQGAHPSLSL